LSLLLASFEAGLLASWLQAAAMMRTMRTLAQAEVKPSIAREMRRPRMQTKVDHRAIVLRKV
jgi:hypothetical protein